MQYPKRETTSPTDIINLQHLSVTVCRFYVSFIIPRLHEEGVQSLQQLHIYTDVYIIKRHTRQVVFFDNLVEDR